MVNFTMLVKNRARLTMQSLASLGRFNGSAVTVLDDHCDKESVDVLNEMQPQVGFYRVLGNNSGTGNARNTVIRKSEKFWGRGDYLYLSDNDVFFKPLWLPQLIERYEAAWEHGFRVLGGYNHPYHLQDETPVPGVKQVQALALQSMLLKWEVWDQFGPFRETPPGAVCQGEDVDFSQAITKAGFKLGVVSPPLLVNCGITNSFGEKIPGWEMVQKECPPGVICE